MSHRAERHVPLEERDERNEGGEVINCNVWNCEAASVSAGWTSVNTEFPASLVEHDKHSLEWKRLRITFITNFVLRGFTLRLCSVKSEGKQLSHWNQVLSLSFTSCIFDWLIKTEENISSDTFCFLNSSIHSASKLN